MNYLWSRVTDRIGTHPARSLGSDGRPNPVSPLAKAVYDMPTTRVLLDRLDTDVALPRICGWERKSEVPSESVFSRAFAEFLPHAVSGCIRGAPHAPRLRP